MPAPESLHHRLDASVDSFATKLRELSLRIHANPELRFAEHRAAQWIAETVTENSSAPVERPLGGLDTALRARVGTRAPRVAILAEYDALPEIGHACGHNLIAAGAVGAFLALAANANDLPGGFDLVGTPAEEGGGGKISLLDAGAFSDVDAAMMFHPFDHDLLAHDTLANSWIAMQFKGTASHAAVAPFEGQSALSACMNTFHLVDSQRVHFRDGVRVHGYVTNGGQAVNIIPEHAACEFSVRATTLPELDRVREIVERCARAAAMAGGVEIEIVRRRGYKNMVNNLPLARAFGTHMKRLGRTPKERDPNIGTGSTDMGDVSHRVPAIHAWVAICNAGETTCHQHAFAECARSERGMTGMLLAAKSMASTAADFLFDAKLREDVRGAYEAR